jgi:hypothetical protein
LVGGTEHVGTWGPQAGAGRELLGTGRLPVADWWLAMARELEDEREAAAKTTDSAKIRMASFIVGYPFRNLN